MNLSTYYTQPVTRLHSKKALCWDWTNDLLFTKQTHYRCANKAKVKERTCYHPRDKQSQQRNKKSLPPELGDWGGEQRGLLRGLHFLVSSTIWIIRKRIVHTMLLDWRPYQPPNTPLTLLQVVASSLWDAFEYKKSIWVDGYKDRPTKKIKTPAPP